MFESFTHFSVEGLLRGPVVPCRAAAVMRDITGFPCVFVLTTPPPPHTLQHTHTNTLRHNGRLFNTGSVLCAKLESQSSYYIVIIELPSGYKQVVAGHMTRSERPLTTLLCCSAFSKKSNAERIMNPVNVIDQGGLEAFCHLCAHFLSSNCAIFSRQMLMHVTLLPFTI